MMSDRRKKQVFNIRLEDCDVELMKAIAQEKDTKPAVLGRNVILRYLKQQMEEKELVAS
jgi:hypothetical protein